MGKEYIRKNHVQPILQEPNILWTEDFGPLGRTAHPFTSAGGTSANRVYDIRSDAGYHKAGPNAFRFGSSNTVGGTVAVEYRESQRHLNGKYRVFVRVRGEAALDDTYYEYFDLWMQNEIKAGPGTFDRVFARLRLYSNYRGVGGRVVQYFDDTAPVGAWRTIPNTIMPWPTFENGCWMELEYTYDVLTRKMLSLRCCDTEVQFERDGLYPNLLFYSTAWGAGPPYQRDWDFAIYTNFANLGSYAYFYVDQIIIEALDR